MKNPEIILKAKEKILAELVGKPLDQRHDILGSMVTPAVIGDSDISHWHLVLEFYDKPVAYSHAFSIKIRLDDEQLVAVKVTKYKVESEEGVFTIIKDNILGYLKED